MSSTTLPSVTIGLPVYNGEAFVADAVESILSQSYQDLELIIADNASTDNTLAIAKAAAARDPRVTVLSSEANRGASWNFNRTVDASRGKYFKWAAHDDVLAPRYLERCVAALEQDPSVVLAFPLSVDIDESGDVLRDLPELDGVDSIKVHRRFAAMISPTNDCVCVFGVYRAESLRASCKILPFTASDRVLLAEIALRGPNVQLEERLFMRRQHSGRSIHASHRERDAWFDPSRKPRGTYFWRLLWEYEAALWRVDLSLAPRLRCHVTLAGWARRHARKLIKEIVAVPIRSVGFRRRASEEGRV